MEATITNIPNGFVATGLTFETFVDTIIKKATKEAWELSKLEVENPFATIKIDEAYAAKYKGRGTVRQRKIYMAAKASKMKLKVKNGKTGTYIYKRDELKFLAEFGIYQTK